MNIKESLIEALKDQKEFFGDELFSFNVPDLNITSEKPNEEAVQEPQEIDMPKKKIIEPLLTGQELDNSDVNESSVGDYMGARTLQELYDRTHDCQRCPLHKTRNKFVFGVGNPNADVMVIGEGPGADEDLQGEPFVGRAGKLLTDILKAINFSREEVYIANIVKSRPPGNRNPLPNEIDACIPYLEKQIELIKPKFILCLGLIAANSLLRSKNTLTKMRGNVLKYKHIDVMVTYHPAALLRNPAWKRACWEDVQQFRKLYDDMTNGKQNG